MDIFWAIYYYFFHTFLFYLCPILSSRKRIEVNHSKRTIKVFKSGVLLDIFNINNIAKIERNKGQYQENNRTLVFPFSFYHHSVIWFVDGNKLVFTDFVAKNLSIKGVNHTERVRFFNYIKV